MLIRKRRLRNNIVRDIFSDVSLSKKDLIYPIFVVEGYNKKEEIESMPEQYRYSVDRLNEIIEELTNLGIKSILLFGISSEKDEEGSFALKEDGLIQNAIKEIKKTNKNIIVIADVCMCAYTSHGHCGILNNNYVDNDKTIDQLSKIALSYAKAGADIVAPSDMMDGRVYKIRKVLDENNYENTLIMSYSVKYSSSFYGPFRDAANSAPNFGDRKSYQMDFKRTKECIDEVSLDIKEGADIVIIKPALSYLDVIHKVSENTNIPIVAYNVSGEYSMVKAASEKGWLNEKEIVLEMMYSMKRAGANLIITYFAKDIVKYLEEGN